MTLLRQIWADPRFRRMVIAVITAIAAYVVAVASGAPLPAP